MGGGCADICIVPGAGDEIGPRRFPGFPESLKVIFGVFFEFGA